MAWLSPVDFERRSYPIFGQLLKPFAAGVFRYEKNVFFSCFKPKKATGADLER
jgi:hypothetical protein